MIFIDKGQWLKDVFAEVVGQQDLLRQPINEYSSLSPKEKDQLRQTQVFQNELVQILAVHENFSLVRKFEKTLGWMPSTFLRTSLQKEFPIFSTPKVSAADFLSSWKGTLYEFGGLSQEGIDCSGFIQLYFLNTHEIILPKNSKDQRKLGVLSSFQFQRDNDLVFCRPKLDPESHHVAIFFSKNLWHSRRKGGVVCQTIEEFLSEFHVEEVRSLY